MTAISTTSANTTPLTGRTVGRLNPPIRSARTR